MEQTIDIKGVREGILIRVNDNPAIAVEKQLQQEITGKREFLHGSRIIVDVGRRLLGENQIASFQKLFEDNSLTLWAILSEDKDTREAVRRAGFATRLAGSATDFEGNALSVEPANNGAAAPRSLPPADALFLRETIRSGRSIWHEGDIVILGDVNPGAEVIAAGSVIVWGRIRGLVHAGALGNVDASICALDLSPTQLRIADQIAVAPNDNQTNSVPEQASIVNGQIVAEAWHIKHAA